MKTSGLFLPTRKKAYKEVTVKYSFEEKLILERIQQIRDEFEHNKKELKKKRENEYERIQRQGSKSSRW